MTIEYLVSIWHFIFLVLNISELNRLIISMAVAVITTCVPEGCSPKSSYRGSCSSEREKGAKSSYWLIASDVPGMKLLRDFEIKRCKYKFEFYF